MSSAARKQKKRLKRLGLYVRAPEPVRQPKDAEIIRTLTVYLREWYGLPQGER